MTQVPLLSLRGLTVRYPGGGSAVSDISLDVAEGTRLGIIGESGSGKSTLARAVAGLLPEGAAVTGTIAWPALGRPPVAGRDVGYVFQDAGASLNPVLTVGELVAEGARRHLGLNRAAARAEALALLDRVHLPDPERLSRSYAHQLSGGQRQRVAIAAAIAARPRLLIADEVTSALDAVTQAAIVSLLEELAASGAMTLVFITHDIALAARLAGDIAVLDGGRLVETGPTGTVLARPAAAATARLIAAHIDLSTPPLVTERAP